MPQISRKNNESKQNVAMGAANLKTLQFISEWDCVILYEAFN